MFWEDIEFADDQGEFPVDPGRKRKPYLSRAGGFDVGHVLVVLGVERMPVGHQGVERPHDVGRRDRHAVVPAGFLPQRVFDPAVVRSDRDGFGQQTVLGERLILGSVGKAVVDQRGAGAGDSLQGEGIERVECPISGQSDGSSLGGVRVGVLEMRECGVVLGFTEERQGVRGDGVVGPGGEWAKQQAGQCAEAQAGQGGAHGRGSSRGRERGRRVGLEP